MCAWYYQKLWLLFLVLKCPLNESRTSIPTDALFHAINSQCFVSSPVIQSVGWHLTIPPGSCSLGTVLQFRVLYGGNLLILSTWQHDSYMHLFSTWYFNHHGFATDRITGRHIKIQWHFMFSSGGTCSFFKVQSHAEKQQAFPQSLMIISGEDKFI